MSSKMEGANKRQQYTNFQLRAIAPKAVWGAREMPNTKNIVSTADNEYIIAVGSSLMAFDNSPHADRRTTLVDSKDPSVLSISLMALSGDLNYLMTVVKVRDNDDNTVHMLVYKVDHNAHGMNSRRPKQMQYKNKAFIAGNGKFEFTCAAFSYDSVYFACGSNIPSVGIVVFDHLRSCVFQTVSIDSSPLCITFNPDDSTKICVSGDNALLKYWRFTNKSVHVAPVVGLKHGHYKYTEHVWVPPYSEGLMIAGSDCGFLTLFVGCEFKGPNIQAFGMEGSSPSDLISIRQILIRGDLVLAVSGGNYVAAYELRRVMHSKGMNSLSPSLVCLKKVRMANVDRLLGLQWCIRDSVTSLAVMGISTQSVFQVEVVSDSDMADASNAVSAAVHASGHQTVERGDDGSLSEASADTDEEEKWLEIINEKNIFKFHSGAINSLSLSSRTNIFVTNSYEDGTIRVWDYNRPTSFRGNWIVENYKDRPQENPFHTAMHPSGLVVAFAIEGEVREYTVTDSSLELYRRISVRAPFTGPTGAANLITQPVSFVKYSNGGHYIAVVTGKIAQLFHVYLNDHTSQSHAAQAQRLMVLSDHNAPITDLDFTRDDSVVITTSSDGSVYSWKVGATSRDQEFVAKGIPATRVCISKHNPKRSTIMVCFEAQNESKLLLAAEVARTRRRSSLNSRRMSRLSSSNANITSSSHLVNGSDHGSHDFNSSPLRHILNEAIGETSPVTGSDHKQQSTSAGLGQSATAGGSRRKPFLAVWQGEFNASPQVLHLETAVRSIALGESNGPDRFDLCVLGLVDGRILLSQLPLPTRIIDPVSSTPATSLPVPANVSTNATVTTTVLNNSNIGPDSSNNSPMASPLPSSSKKVLMRTGIMSKSGMRRKASAGPMELSALRASMTLNDTTGEFSAAPGSPIIDGIAHAIPGSPALGAAQGGNLDGEVARNTIGNNSDSIVEDESGVHGGAGGIVARSKDVLDESSCRAIRVHLGAVSFTMIAKNGMWIFSAGEDGTIIMYAVTKRAMEMQEIQASSDNFENKFLVIDKARLQGLITQLLDMQHSIEQNKKDYALKVEKIVESRKKMIDDLETRRKREIKHRDEAILSGRQEYLKLKTAMTNEISTIRKQCNDTIAEMEMVYEKKLAQESLYLEKMKQAYDEYVIHAQMDLQELRSATDSRVSTIESEKEQALKEAERQKAAVLKYFEFLQLRNDELFQSMEEKQVEERCKLKDELDSTQEVLQKAQGQILTGEVQANREINKLKGIVEEKENEVLKLRSDVDWANNRIMQLEHAVQQATAELGSRTEMSEKWELKAGEMQQKIIELEKLRKALTTQLHTLRQELGPKEEALLNITGKLQETEREYEHSMHAIAEKEKTLNQKGENLNLLQKQVRELRNASSRKEKVLRRAATLLDEYRYALQQAYFRVEKRTVPKHGVDGDHASEEGALSESVAGNGVGSLDDGASATGRRNRRAGNGTNGEVVEIIAQNEGMNAALKRLTDVLSPFLNEENIDAELMDEMEAVRKEQERHMNLLHRSVSGLRANLEFQQSVASVKVSNHLIDNQNLLKEVNALRLEVRNLSLDNQRLSAQLEFNNTSMKRRAAPDQSVQSVQQLQAMYEQQLEYNRHLQRQLLDSRMNSTPKRVQSEEELPASQRPSQQASASSGQTRAQMQKSASSAIIEDRYPSQAAYLKSVLSQTAPAAAERIPSTDTMYSTPISAGDDIVPSQHRDDLRNKNEFNAPADEKIAALMQMNAQEIKALMANQKNNDSSQPRRNLQHWSITIEGGGHQQGSGIDKRSRLPQSGVGDMNRNSNRDLRASMELTGLSIASVEAGSANITPQSSTSGTPLRAERKTKEHSQQTKARGSGKKLPPVVGGNSKFGLKAGKHSIQ